MTPCRWISQVQPGEVATWGVEAQALASVARAGVPVLPGFVVSSEAVASYFLQTDVRSRITKACKGLSVRVPGRFGGVAKEIREIILSTPLPPSLCHSYAAFLDDLEEQLLLKAGTGLELSFSWGEYHHHGHPPTLAAADLLLRQTLALAFTEQELFTRYREELPAIPAPEAVLVRYAPESEISGTAQQFDPVSQDGTVIVIEVGHHHHARYATEHVDRYRFDASSLLLLSKEEVTHRWARGKKKHEAPTATHSTDRLPERQLALLARFTRRAQLEAAETVTLQWQLHQGAVTITGVQQQSNGSEAVSSSERPLAVGHGIAVGMATGPVRLIAKKSDWKLVQDGEVVVVEQLHAEDGARLAGTAALITEAGHHTSSEATVAAGLGIPAVSAVPQALRLFRTGQLVTVDGAHGAVYAGRPAQGLKPHGVAPERPITGTKLYAAVDDALRLTPTLLGATDGIGMLRGEFILRLLGTHPSEVLHQGMAAEYQELLQEGVERAVRAAVGKPVLYQLHDIAEHSFHGHRSWKRSTHEPNRQMGNRGSRRLLQEPDVLSLELQALGHLERQGHEQLALLLPMVRSLAEFTQLQRVIEKETPGYADRLWVRVETPALAIVADQLALAGPAGVVFDIPAIATLITGVDAENHEIGHERNQADPAVLDALRFAVASCRAHGVPTVVLGEHEALRPEIVEVAIRAGVTAVCVQPEEASWTRDLMASIEQKMLLDHVVGDGLEDPHHAHED